MSQHHQKQNHDLRFGTNIVEPGTIPGPCGVDELEIDTARFIIGVQDVHLSINLLIGDVTILQGIILGDDVDYTGSKHKFWVL